MRSEVSRIYEMGTRVVSFEDAHPDTDEGHLLSVQMVKDVVAQMKDVAAAQRAGLVDKGAGSAEKARLRREILAGPVAHLAEVGKRSSRSGFELGRTYRYKPGAQTYTAFLTAARAMQGRAQTDAKVLVKFGLSASVLAQLGELLDKFEAAVALGNDGRTQHKGATKQLDGLATELASVVRTMDARNRQRFEDNRQLLASWVSASTVLGTKRGIGVSAEVPAHGSEPVGPEAGAEPGGTPVVEGDVRPAA
jgi:high-affinity Fe2+/Pb2+ permease